MTRVRPDSCLLVAIALPGGTACQLKRPQTTPGRMIEPQLLEPQPPESARQGDERRQRRPRPVARYTSARTHRPPVLHQQPDGELIEDAVWRWSSAPDRYLDTALHLELASSPGLRLVDAASAPALAATLLAWHLESAGGTRLVGAVEFQFTGPTASSTHTSCEQASPCQPSCLATWPPRRAAFCAGSRWRA